MYDQLAFRSKCTEDFNHEIDCRVQLLVTALFIATAYYIGALLSFTLRVPSTRSSILWIPNAILMVAFVVTPVKRWWLWTLAAAPAHILAQSRDAAPILVLCCPFIANVAQAALAAFSLRLLSATPHRLSSFRNMGVFILVAVIAVPAVVSFTAAGLFVLAGWETDYWLVGQARLLNNVVTGLTIAPICFAIADGDLKRLPCLQIHRYVEFAVLLLGLILTLLVTFEWHAAETINFPFRLYAPLPFLLWAAVRFGPPVLAIALLAVAYDSIADSILNQAYFGANSPAASVLALEASLGVLSLPLMLLAALMQERQHKEEALRESQERLARTEKFSLVMVTHTDLEGRWLKVPPTLCELLGYSEQELLGRRFDELTHPDDVEINLSRRLQLLRDEIKSFDLEKRYLRKDGGIVWVYINVSIVLDANGIPVHFLSYIRDISRGKQAEQGLRESEERLQLALEAGGMGVWDWDTCSNALEWSSEHYTIMGVKPHSITPTYQTWADRVHPDDRAVVTAEIQRAISERSHYRSEYRIVLPDGSHRWLISRGETVYRIDGECVRVTGVTVDITDRKRAESRLNVQYQITRLLSSSASLADAAPAMIQTICQCFELHCGEIWQVNSEAEVLEYLEGWHSPSMELAPFVSESRQFTVSPGVGLPGRVWKSATPEWIINLSADANFPGASLAERSGLKSAFGFPVAVGDRTLAVMAFFSANMRQPDEELLQTMESIGRQIGQLMERKKAEHVTFQRDQLLHTMFDSLSFHVVVLDRDGTITYASKLAEQFTINQLLNNLSVGINYLDVCRRAASLEDGNVKEALCGIENVLTRQLSSFSIEYRCDASERARWFAMQVDPMPRDHGGVVISHADITERMQVDEALRNALGEVRQLKEQLEVENTYLREEVSSVHRFGEIGGRSDSIVKALRHAELVAPTDATVLITGETGTGKELLARAVHARSNRSQRPLIKVDCAGLPASLIESELFGHEKGAFTGAATRRIGRFELANEATIFLDEVGELPLELQTKLLRVLQEGEFERLGSSKTIKVSTRVIAATNRDLGLAVKTGVFRDDLYYRLNVYPIKLPPLRDRKEDIPELIETFLSEASRRLGRSFNGLSQRAIDDFMKYDWPGNVRELQNVIERIAVTAKGGKLSLPSDWMSDSLSQAPDITCHNPRLKSNVAPEETTIESLERAHIVRVLEQRHWRIEGPHGAAIVLGLNPSTLRSRMRKLRIDRPFDAEDYH
ncbi:MAG TPA: sigma 54-interacting transcriptional regulator [Candidatus Polarisedimenticolaceae bacterium]|nr:sigma 54-interacting transcriptional regulator [Candidatus Polarisedimenticolaceae bacterium]